MKQKNIETDTTNINPILEKNKRWNCAYTPMVLVFTFILIHLKDDIKVCRVYQYNFRNNNSLNSLIDCFVLRLLKVDDFILRFFFTYRVS